MKTFLTGGSGFVGGNLVRLLLKTGHSVRALARSQNAQEAVAHLGASPVEGNLADVKALCAGMSGCDTVFHCAAAMEFWNEARLQEQVNVVGTRNVVNACRKTGVSCLVFISAAAVLSAGGPIHALSEKHPIPPQPFGAYAQSKAEGERLVLSANSSVLKTVAVRPPAIWGLGDRHLLPEIVRAVQSRHFLWVNKGRYPYETCHVRNVCEGALLASQKGAGGQAYFLTDTEKTTFREFVTDLLATQGMAPGRLSVPRAVAWTSAAFLEALWRLLRLKGRPPITRALLSLIGMPIELSDAKARKELGYAGHVTRSAGLEELRHAFSHLPPSAIQPRKSSLRRIPVARNSKCLHPDGGQEIEHKEN
jgi:nucleoside-diphosphate-sugar epimerase